MKLPASVYQYLPGVASGDAVTTHALEIQKALQQWGVSSQIYAPSQHVKPACRDWCRDYREANHNGGAATIHLYHFSIGSELSHFISRQKGKKVMIYHNITPHSFFIHFNSQRGLAAYTGREQLQQLASDYDLALGDSEYNRKELEKIGFQKTGVLPLFIEADDWEEAAEDAIPFDDGFVNFLFVGRVVPNKKIEDLIKTFYFYQKTIDSRCRLYLVGPTEGFEKYKNYLETFCASLDVRHVIFTGRVSPEERNRLYKQADIFLCLSEHEGFCMPLLEAMHFGAPVIAYAAAAVPETLGRAGVLIQEKDFQKIAEMAHQIVVNEELRKKIRAGQRERLKDFDRSKAENKLKEYLEL